MPDVKWIKLTTDMFDDEKISIIESMPDADSLIVIWVKLICQAGKTNNDGYIYLSKDIPYTEETLATILRRPINTIRLALKTFIALKMLEKDEAGYLLLPNFEKHQSLDGLALIRENTRNRVARFRERERFKQLPEGCNVTGNTDVTPRVDIDKNKNIDKSREDKDNTPSKFFIYKNYKIPLSKITGADVQIKDGIPLIFYQSLEKSIQIAQGKLESSHSVQLQHQNILNSLNIDWSNGNGSTT